MENEKKRNKVLEIILIILVSLSFVLIPLLNQYRQKIISQNNSELVKRGVNTDGSSFVGENGKISIYFFDKDVPSIYGSWNSFEIPRNANFEKTIYPNDLMPSKQLWYF